MSQDQQVAIANEANGWYRADQMLKAAGPEAVKDPDNPIHAAVDDLLTKAGVTKLPPNYSDQADFVHAQAAAAMGTVNYAQQQGLLATKQVGEYGIETLKAASSLANMQTENQGKTAVAQILANSTPGQYDTSLNKFAAGGGLAAMNPVQLQQLAANLEKEGLPAVRSTPQFELLDMKLTPGAVDRSTGQPFLPDQIAAMQTQRDRMINPQLPAIKAQIAINAAKASGTPPPAGTAAGGAPGAAGGDPNPNAPKPAGAPLAAVRMQGPNGQWGWGW
jgi:hypothetical protein